MYSSEDGPSYMPGEASKLTRNRPILMIPSRPEHKLHPASRLNYAKVYTVEYNVKVKFIGRIHPESGHHVVAAYNEIHAAPVLPFQRDGLESGVHSNILPLLQTTAFNSTKSLDPPIAEEPLVAFETSESTMSKGENEKIFDQSEHVSSKTDVSIEDQTYTHGKSLVDDSSVDIDNMSFISAEDDVNSQLARPITIEMAAAEKQLGMRLAYNEELRPLFTIAISERFKKENHIFVKNIRRLLKWYYIDLCRAARTNLEKVSTELIRSNGGRFRIARHISDFIFPIEDTALQLPMDLAGKEEIINDWLDRLFLNSDWLGAKEKFEQDEDCLEISSNESNASSEDDEAPYTATNLEVAENFMLEGESCQRLSKRLQMWLLPSSLASLNRVLMSIPAEDMWFSDSNDYSISNLFKILIENVTEQDWDWWPLRPKMRMLNRGERRINWTCVSSLIDSSIHFQG